MPQRGLAKQVDDQYRIDLDDHEREMTVQNERRQKACKNTASRSLSERGFRAQIIYKS